MKPFRDFPVESRQDIQFVLTDIDDTLTHQGRLPAAAYDALEHLQAAGRVVVPITGRPAGWCDHMARMWPIDGIIGENGAFYFAYDHRSRRMQRRYFKTTVERQADRARLEALAAEIVAQVPACRVSADQAYREADLAIDFCEDVAPLPPEEVARIVACFEAAGAQAKVSSIHVNGWYGAWDKLTMTAVFFREQLGVALETVSTRVLFAGDSPNDVPMFAYFPHTVGMANILNFKTQLTVTPAWITDAPGGFGFAEMAANLLA